MTPLQVTLLEFVGHLLLCVSAFCAGVLWARRHYRHDEFNAGWAAAMQFANEQFKRGGEYAIAFSQCLDQTSKPRVLQ